MNQPPHASRQHGATDMLRACHIYRIVVCDRPPGVGEEVMQRLVIGLGGLGRRGKDLRLVSASRPRINWVNCSL